MSTGDYVRFLRAVKGGATPWDIEQATGVPSSTYRQIEQRYRDIGSDEEMAKLAEYFGVAPGELLDRREWTRKALSSFLADACEEERPVRLFLRTGDTLEGTVAWFDLGATLLRSAAGEEVVVQRHIIDRWEAA
jgi:sRNA-binding regulator protein Hfq